MPHLNISTNHSLAYHLTEGVLPGVVFCGGFKSDMTGSKATALEAFCKARGQRFLRFDYSGHGASSGDFMDGTIGAWKNEVLEITHALMDSPHILVGSSMGAWLALLAIGERPANIKGFIGIASAPDFTEKLIWKKLSPEQQKNLMETGVFYAPSCYGEAPYPITKQLIEEARNHLLLTANGQPLTATLPIRLLHGTLDADVPWQNSVDLMEKLGGDNVQLTLVKNGDHRMSSTEHLHLLCDTLEKLLESSLRA